MKRLLIVLCSVLATNAVSAQQLSEQEALSKAKAFFSFKGGLRKARISGNNLRATGSSDSQPFYVFNRGEDDGFVVIAGDERAYDVLGYSDTGSVSDTSMPDGLKALLQRYSSEIEDLQQGGNSVKAVDKSKVATFASPVLPLVTTRWEQTYPYFLMTPYYVGTTHAATGCVATAMAQIMNFNEWPYTGKGSHTYTPYGWQREVSADFSQSNYQWDLMLDIYDENSPKESCNAVALLMRDCGISVDMTYGESSGASCDSVAMALMRYFSYDKGVGLHNRNYYSESEWNRVIRKELDEGYPVFAAGYSTYGGHAFVFDGYDAEGLIHVNWGWAGKSDGYFRTSALEPLEQGTGGSEGGFNYRQYIVTGIRPPYDGSEQALEFVSSEKTKCTPDKGSINDVMTLNLTGKITNYDWQSATVDFGFGIFTADVDENLLQIIEAQQSNYFFKPNTYSIGVKATDVSLAGLSDGNYVLRPIVRNSGGQKWTKIHDFKYTKSNSLKLIIENGQYSFAAFRQFQLSADIVEIPDSFYRYSYFTMKTKVKNSGELEYNGELRAAIFNSKGDKVAESDAFLQVINPDEETELTMTGIFNVEPGEYTLHILDINEQKVSDALTVKVVDGEAPTGITTISADDAVSPEYDPSGIRTGSSGVKGIKIRKGKKYIK